MRGRPNAKSRRLVDTVCHCERSAKRIAKQSSATWIATAGCAGLAMTANRTTTGRRLRITGRTFYFRFHPLSVKSAEPAK